MDSTRPAPASNLNSLWRTLTKIRRLRSDSGGGSVPLNDGDKIRNLKFSGNLGMFSAKLSTDEKKQQQQQLDSLLAKLFAGVSAVKAAYAELQVAQSPYDPESIQAADLAVVCELMRLSELKQSYLKGELTDDELFPNPEPAQVVQIQEQRNLIKTYKITTRKLESDLQLRDADVRALRSRLLECSAPSPDLHLSGLNPTHFLAFLRRTVKSVRSFSRQLTKMMELADWDLDAAANSVHPGALRSSAHRCFAFESYVAHMMFSDFQHRDFSLGSLEEMSRWGRRNFFEEFRAAKGGDIDEWLARPLGKFCRVKYLLLLHPRMESAFFGDLEQRELVSSGRGFPGSELFTEFAEMARRVWLLHCLFFSFDEEAEASIFQVRRGCRFSEVFMESVAGEDDDERPAVGFTVVPGFRMRGTVIQCKVYLSSS